MKPNPALQRIQTLFEALVVAAMQLMLMIVVAIAVLELFWLLYSGIAALIREVHSVPDLQKAVQRGFGGVLLVLLGLELLETLKTFFTEQRVRLELILIVAIIAVGRHIILLDFEQVGGLLLVGVGALVLALTVGYFLVKQSLSSGPSPERESEL